MAKIGFHIYLHPYRKDIVNQVELEVGDELIIYDGKSQPHVILQRTASEEYALKVFNPALDIKDIERLVTVRSDN